MPKTRTTLTIDESVLRAAKVQAARAGQKDSEFIEEAVKDKLGLSVFERAWARYDMDEDEAMALALEAQHETRKLT